MADLADLFSRLFGRSKTTDSTPPAPPAPQAGNAGTTETLREYFGITREEMDARLRRLRIYTPDGTLTQEQVDLLHDDNVRGGTKPQAPKPPVQRRPEYVSLAGMVHDFSDDYDTAKAEYTGKWIAFSGQAEDAVREGQNFVVRVIPDEAGFHGAVICKFVNNYEQRLSVLPRGKSINFSGFVSNAVLSYENDTIILINSGILDEIAVPVSPTPKTVRKPEYVSPSQIVRDHMADPFAAKAKYSGKWIAFSCRFETFRPDGVNFVVYVVPEDRSFRGNVICRFVSNAREKLSALSPGQRIEIAGFVKEVIHEQNGSTVIITNSSILDSQPEAHSKIDNVPGQKPQPPRKFIVSPMTTMKDEILPRSEIAVSGSKVYTESGREYTLGEMVGSPGGEGTVYEITNLQGRVAKIYNADHCTTRTREKIKLMVRAGLNYNGIRFPLEVLNTQRGEFTGFVMERAKGNNLGMLFEPQSEFEKDFPGWKKIDIVKLCISILKRIEYLHKYSVLMGDINPNNIMFVSPDEVYFIDTDSYQYRGFPCRVGTENYIPPELQGVDLGTVMRTLGNENFAVATLMFMILMQGKQPYAHQGSTQSGADIKAGIFPYGAGERPVPGNVWEIQPFGLWRYIWSHLTFAIKDAFIDTFRKDGHNNTESTRFPVSKWLTLMYAYHTALPAMAKNDPMSAEIFPTREKMSINLTYRTCKYCHETKPESMFYDEDTCKDCHEQVRNEVYSSFICTDCGKIFEFTNGEYEYYTSRGLQFPKKCPDCRKAKNERWGFE